MEHVLTFQNYKTHEKIRHHEEETAKKTYYEISKNSDIGIIKNKILHVFWNV